QRCGAPPGQALADSGFFSLDNLNQMEQRKIDAYVPDSNMARALNLGVRCLKSCPAIERPSRSNLRIFAALRMTRRNERPCGTTEIAP
ncbi:MAG: hypothetical protein WCC31_08375, partial [Terracidiphilus sp.]